MSSEDLNLTPEQYSVNILIRLRGRFITPADVQEVDQTLDYAEAKAIAVKCNEYLLEMQRFLYSKV